MMAYTNSPLATYKKLSPKYTAGRKNALTRITPHCVVGQWTCENIAREFYATGRRASCNYGIGYDGRVALIVEEKNRAWTSNSSDNDGRAITIEVASDTTHPYAFRQAAWDKLVDLCVDICKRNGKKKLLWLGTKQKSLAYTPKPDEMVLTAHRWFAAKACPGDWMYSREGELAEKVTSRLNGYDKATTVITQEEIDMTKAEVQKMIDDSVQRYVQKALKGSETKVSDWAKEEYENAVEAGITDGTRPGGYATREQVAVMIVRAIKALTKLFKDGGGCE